MTIDPLLTLAHTMVSAPGTQAVLLGSGVSRSAQILTGWEVTLDLVRRLAVMQGAGEPPDLEAWYTDTYGKAPDYSDLLLGLAKTGAERRSLLQSYFEPTEAEREAGAKLPTAAHRAIGRLVAQGFVKVVLTTNFDRLMETALRDEGIEPIVVSTADGTKGAAPLVHQRCLVVKLHGDYLDDRVKNTEAELTAYDPHMNQYLDRILDEFGLIICGWSGEWDTALRAALERCKSRRYTTTWVTMGAPRPKTVPLIALRDAQVVSTSGADSFFSGLEEKITSLVDLKSAPPSSAATAVAALKRYVAEDRHRVRFEDLLLTETNQLTAKLQAHFSAEHEPSPTADLMLQKLRRMEAATETMRAVYFHACRLAAASQEQVLLRVLALLTHEPPPTSTSRYVDWTDLASYPATTVFYSGAMGALASGNWGLLRKLLLFFYNVHGEDRLACDRLAVWRLPSRVADTLFLPQTLNASANRNLAALITPLAKELHPEPDLLFDELEVWVALAYADFVPDLPTFSFRIPSGRFRWQHHLGARGQPYKLFADAEAQGADWPPFAVGWFNGRPERWQQVKESLLTFLSSRFPG